MSSIPEQVPMLKASGQLIDLADVYQTKLLECQRAVMAKQPMVAAHAWLAARRVLKQMNALVEEVEK